VPNRSANCATQQCLFGESHTLAFRSRRRSLRAGLVVIDAHVVTDAPPRKVEECRCRKELSRPSLIGYGNNGRNTQKWHQNLAIQ